MASFQPQYPGLGLAASPTAPVAPVEPMPAQQMAANAPGFGVAPMPMAQQQGPATTAYMQGLASVIPKMDPMPVTAKTENIAPQTSPIVVSQPAQKSMSAPEIVDKVDKGLSGLKSLISPATGVASGGAGAGLSGAGAGAGAATGAAAAGTTAATGAAAGGAAAGAGAAGAAAAGGSAATAAGLGTAGTAAGLGAAGAAGLATGGVGALAGLGLMGLMALFGRHKKPDEASIGA